MSLKPSIYNNLVPNFATMLKLSLLLLSAMLFLSSCSEDDITDTQKKMKETDAGIAGYKSKVIELPMQKDEGGSVTMYTRDGKLVLTTDTAYTQSGTSSARYYFDDEDLAAVVQNEYVYNQPIYYTREMAIEDGSKEWHDDRKTVKKTNSYYFYNNRMVKWVNENGVEISDNNKKYELQQAILIKDAEKIKKMNR